MANVTMDLAELKALENKIENLEETITDLRSKQKQVLILHKYFIPKVTGSKTRNIRVTGIHEEYRYSQDFFTGGKTLSHSFDKLMTAEEMINREIISINLTEDFNKSSSEYVNLSEIIDKISAEKEELFKDQIDVQYHRALQAEETLRTSTEDLQKRILVIQKERDEKIKDVIDTLHNTGIKYEKKLVDQKETYEKTISTLKEDYELLKNDKKRVSLEQQIADLQAQLLAEKQKSIFQKLFNK